MVGRHAQIKRRIGPKRTPSTSDGLTRSLAEAELRKMIGAIGPAPTADGT